MLELQVNFTPRWCSIGACMEAVLRSMGSTLDFVDVLGHTALAFRINVSSRIGVSGPTSLDWISLLPDMAAQLGYELAMVHGLESDKGFKYVQHEALEFIEEFLRQGRPVIAWDVWIPEFGLIIGIDEKKEKLLVKTVLGDPSKSTFPVKKLGRGTVPLLLVFSFEDPLEDYDREETLYWSFQSAWKHLKGLEKALPTYTLGLAAYENWIKSLQDGSITWDGHAYMIQYLLEVRSTIPVFLKRIIEDMNLLEQHRDTLMEIKTIYDTTILPLLTELAEKFPFQRPFRAISSESEMENVINALQEVKTSEDRVATLLKHVK